MAAPALPAHVSNLELSMFDEKMSCESDEELIFNNLPIEEAAPAIKRHLEACYSIDRVYLSSVTMTSIIMDEFINSKTNFKHLDAYYGAFNASVAEFLSFTKKFETRMFFEIEFNKELWSDEVNIEIVQSAKFDQNTKDEVDFVADQLTDRTLAALLADSSAQELFRIGNIHTAFTVRGIVDILKIAHARKNKDLRWNLGILSADQAADARQYFEEDTSELSNGYNIRHHTNDRHIIYEVTNLDMDPAHFSFSDYPMIRFEVPKPN